MTAADEVRSRHWLHPVAHLAIAAGLGFGVPRLAALATGALPIGPGSLAWLYAQHGLQAALALAFILILRRRFAGADFGLRWPRGPSYAALALAGGCAFGLVASLFTLLVTGRPDRPSYVPTPGNIVGWMGFECFYVGPTEEIPFRSLVMTYLAITVPGRVKIGRLDLSVAGVVAAAIFALNHWGYGAAPVLLALSQQLYAFALGLFYAWCFERSGSLLAPMIAHNASDGIVTLLQLGALLAPG